MKNTLPRPQVTTLLDLPEEQVVGGVVPADHVAVGAVRGKVLVAVAAGDHQQFRSCGRGRRRARRGGQRDDWKWEFK